MKEVFAILPRAFRRRGLWVACTLLLRAALNFLGLAMLLPVLALVLDPGSLEGEGTMARIYVLSGLESPRTFALAVCAAVVAVIVLKCLTALWLARIERNYIYDLYRTLSRRLYVTYHDRGLPFVKASNSAVLARNVNVVSLAFTAGVLKPAAAIAADAMLLVLLFGALSAYAPVAALLAVVVFVPSIWLYYGLVKGRIDRYGAQENKAQREKARLVAETFRGYADIEINNAFPMMLRAFDRAMDEVIRTRLREGAIGLLPQTLTEIGLAVGMAVLAALSLGTEAANAQLLFGVFAVAALRLMPSVRNIMAGWTAIKYNRYTIDILRDAGAEEPTEGGVRNAEGARNAKGPRNAKGAQNTEGARNAEDKQHTAYAKDGMPARKASAARGCKTAVAPLPDGAAPATENGAKTMRKSSESMFRSGIKPISDSGTNAVSVPDPGSISGTGTETLRGTATETISDTGATPLSRNGTEAMCDTGTETVPGTGTETMRGTETETISDTGAKPVSRNGTEAMCDTGTETMRGTETETISDTGAKPVSRTGTAAMCDAGTEQVRGNTEKLPFEREIAVRDLSFRFADDGHQLFSGFSLTIRKGERIGLRGASGAGKTTLFNLLLGLYEPTGGEIAIDGVPLTASNRRAWQNRIGYVSQSLFIADGSFAANVALGVPSDEVDRVRVVESLRAARLGEFVEALPKGIDTPVGECGCRLSGGQRQRIGIARALYRQADVLFFDEATSALDSRTEEDINRSIAELAGRHKGLTLVVIAHRESSLEYCHRIITIGEK